VTPRPALIRWAGFAGSVATAGSAYLGGSGFVRVPSVNPVTLLRGEKGVLLPICWVLGTALLIGAWWFGRQVVPSMRWALLTVGLWLLPVLPFLPLGSADVYSYACQGYVQYAGGDPYAGGVQSFGCPWLSSVDQSWRDSPAPYGPLFLLLAARAVAVAGGSLAAVIAGLRVVALAGLALTALGLPVLARRAGIDPAKAVWTVLACPIVLVHLVSGAHNDALMIGLIVAGLALVASRRIDHAPAWLVAGGAVLGLAVAVKATAVVILPFAVLAAVPPGSPWRALWRPAAAIGGGAVAASALLSLISGRGLGWVAGLLRSGDSVTWTSPSTAVGLTVNLVARAFGGHLDAVPVTRVIGVLLLAGILVALWWRARAGSALPGAGLALAATVLCAPVFHPWYATWPLAVLAAVRAETRWLLVPCAFAATLTLPAGYNWALATRNEGAVAVTAGLLALAATVQMKRERVR
jgi:alpha-1,6-mannosyltransferase